jgi:two-component system cell cycle sensor histidine kinase/response regulator CckA
MLYFRRFATTWLVPFSAPPERLRKIATIMQMEAPGNTRRKPCILVAEDEPGLRRLVAETLKRDGFEVIEAENGVVALSFARKHRGTIDLLITDVEMPALDGFDLQEKFQQERPETKLLVISGALPRSVRGVDFPLLRKPFLPSELSSKVQELISKPE